MSKKVDPIDPKVAVLAGVLMVGALAVVFDTTIVNVAIDKLAEDLMAPLATVQWVVTGYLLALAMAVPVTGWLLDRFGGKAVWTTALAIFLAASVLCSLAWDAPSLIAFRILQGVGGGLMLPVMQTLVVQAAGRNSLGRISALLALPALLGPILGPVLGGYIVETINWRWIFWINVPFCLAGIALAIFLIPPTPPVRRLAFDTVGFLLLSPGIAALLFGLSRGAVDSGFLQIDVVLPVLAGLLLVTLFVARALRRPQSALIDIRLFRVASLSAATLQLFLSGLILYGAQLLIPLFAQRVLGYDSFSAGLLIVPQGIGALLSRPVVGRLADTTGARWIVIVGFVLIIAGTLPFAVNIPELSTGPWWLAAALVVRGFGLGAVTVPVMAAAYVDLERSQVPHASIITRTAQQVGGSFGVAAMAVILETGLHGTAPLPAFQQSFVWTIGLAGVAIATAFWLPVRRETTT